MTLCESIRKYVKNMPNFDHPWEILEFLNTEKLETDLKPRKVEGLENAEVYCGENVTIQPYVLFTGKVFLGDNVRIGPFSFIRGTTIIGSDSLVGPHSEVMRTCIGQKCTLAHKALLGDSIIMDNSWLAGNLTVCNFSTLRSEIKVYSSSGYSPYKGKFGVFIEPGVQIGSNTIIMPGTYIKENSKIIGQCVVHGNNKIKPMVKSRLNEDAINRDSICEE